MARTRVYSDGRLMQENFPPADISDLLEQPGTLVWLDLVAPDAQELQILAEEFDLHHLALEDAVKRRQRPKLDHYASHLFLSAHSTRIDPDTGELAVSEVATFILDRALITVRSDDRFDIDDVMKRWDEGQLPVLSIGVLLHGLIDYAVDTHFSAVQEVDDQLEDLEDLLFDDKPKPNQVQRRSFEIRKSLVLLRRMVLPMREVVNALMRPNLNVCNAETQPYFQDVYDHVLRVTEWTESLRDLVSTVLETNLTIQGNRMNLIMKQVTSWAAVIAVPTAVTGFYGQNVPYPGFGHWSGFIISSVVIVALSAALITLFRRNDWL